MRRLLPLLLLLGPAAADSLDDALALAGFDRAALGAAAMLVGLSRTMLDMTIAYAIERQQFGVPIGSFQAVKHHLADATLAEIAAEVLHPVLRVTVAELLARCKDSSAVRRHAASEATA